jgi:hypothetical protein
LESRGRQRQGLASLLAFVLALPCVRIGSSSGRQTASSTEGNDRSGLQEVISHAASEKVVIGPRHRFVGDGRGMAHAEESRSGRCRVERSRGRRSAVTSDLPGADGDADKGPPDGGAGHLAGPAAGAAAARQWPDAPLGPSVQRRRAAPQPLVVQIWWAEECRSRRTHELDGRPLPLAEVQARLVRRTSLSAPMGRGHPTAVRGPRHEPTPVRVGGASPLTGDKGDRISLSLGGCIPDQCSTDSTAAKSPTGW